MKPEVRKWPGTALWAVICRCGVDDMAMLIGLYRNWKLAVNATIRHWEEDHSGLTMVPYPPAPEDHFLKANHEWLMRRCL